MMSAVLQPALDAQAAGGPTRDAAPSEKEPAASRSPSETTEEEVSYSTDRAARLTN